MTELLELPTVLDYTAAVILCENDLKSEGGPWQAIIRRQQDTTRLRSVYNQNFEAGKIALTFEPVDKGGYVIDPYMEATHAFKHGILAGHRITNKVHRGHYSPEESTYQLGLLSHGGDESENLLMLGNEGISLVGEVVSHRIEQWSEAVVSNSTLRHLHTLGCGAVIYATYQLHAYRNQDYINHLLSEDQAPDDLSRYVL